jgi:predicted DNA-binding transcriptional regulator AlpA
MLRSHDERAKMTYQERDPVLSIKQMCQDAGISKATWYRRWAPVLPIVQVSPRRRGTRQSAWRAALDANAFADVADRAGSCAIQLRGTREVLPVEPTMDDLDRLVREALPPPARRK